MADNGDPGIPEADDADPVRDYLKQVSNIPGLTADQEAELARRIEAALATWWIRQAITKALAGRRPPPGPGR
jgi:DNA-directed RNA polymerase sigma subunit (sigma70/sigma32)